MKNVRLKIISTLPSASGFKQQLSPTNNLNDQTSGPTTNSANNAPTATGFKQQLSLNNGFKSQLEHRNSKTALVMFYIKKLHLLMSEQIVRMMLIKISTVQTLHPPLDHIYFIYVYKCYC